jgi:DNA (cytosine-5)-methyltransferase 1
LKNHVALFAGMGGFAFATEELGYKTIWANEIEPLCCDLLEKNFQDIVVNRKSISDLRAEDLAKLPKDIELLTAGFPCQSFSQAGGEFKAFDDPRGKLFFDIPRVIDLMPSPPKVVLLENVPIIKSFDNGALLRTVLNEMRFAGYWVQEKHAQVLSCATYGGTPQRRERLFVVCVHESHMRNNPYDFQKIPASPSKDLFQVVDRSQKLDDEYYLLEDNKYFKLISVEAEKNGTERLFQIRRIIARSCPLNSCPTLTANMGGGGHNVPFVFDDFGLRRLSETECLLMQGYDPERLLMPTGIMKKDLLKMIGNAVSVGTVKAIIAEINNQIFCTKVD